MSIVVKKTRNVTHVDPGQYMAKIVGVSEILTKKDGSKLPHGPFLVWTFRIKDPVHDGEDVDAKVTVTGVTPMELEEGKKLDKLLQSAGMDVDVDDEIDIEDVIGKVVMVKVEDDPRGDVVYSKVTDVSKPPRLNKAAKKKAAEVAKKKTAAKKASESEEEEPEEDEAPEDDPIDDDDDLFNLD